MYVRPPTYRYPPSVRLPDNYSGNAFREQETPPLLPDPTEPEAPSKSSESDISESEQEPAKAAPTSLLSPHSFRLRLGSVFGKKGGIGTEDLLIIALILLLSDNDSDSFDDLILFLALLFFIK